MSIVLSGPQLKALSSVLLEVDKAGSYATISQNSEGRILAISSEHRGVEYKISKGGHTTRQRY